MPKMTVDDSILCPIGKSDHAGIMSWDPISQLPLQNIGQYMCSPFQDYIIFAFVCLCIALLPH